MNKVKQFIVNLLQDAGTGKPCIARVLAIVSFLAYLGYAFFGVFHTGIVDMHNFADGLMQTLIGCGSVMAGKSFLKN